MGYYGHGSMGGHWWPFAGLCMLAFFVALTAVMLAIMRHYRPLAHTGPVSPARGSAVVILQERFARGDIDEDEYRRRLKLLHEPPPS